MIPCLAYTGPAGVMCAFNLSQAGLVVRIVDQKEERMLKGQGDYLQIRGLEILDVSPCCRTLVLTTLISLEY